jgi:hypothetical protein
LYPEDPKPDYVFLNNDFIADATLQENNAVVLINTNTSRVINSYSAGAVDLTKIELIKDGIISQKRTWRHERMIDSFTNNGKQRLLSQTIVE